MNKRIQELAELCETKEVGYYFFDRQKFAELIIQECADVLMKPEYTMTHPDDLSDYNKGWVNGRLLGVEQINDRFSITP